MKYMKNTLIFASFIAVVMTVSGCDFFRSLVGRPTSEWIAKKAETIAADKEFRESIEQIIEDSEADGAIPAIQGASEASNSTDPSEASVASVTSVTPDNSGNGLPYNYYIVIGVFSSHANAKALADKAIAKGYECALLDWKDNKLAVALNPTNDLAVACSSLDFILQEPFCPKDAWIMDGNRNRI